MVWNRKDALCDKTTSILFAAEPRKNKQTRQTKAGARTAKKLLQHNPNKSSDEMVERHQAMRAGTPQDPRVPMPPLTFLYCWQVWMSSQLDKG